MNIIYSLAKNGNPCQVLGVKRVKGFLRPSSVRAFEHGADRREIPVRLRGVEAVDKYLSNLRDASTYFVFDPLFVFFRRWEYSSI